MNVIFVLLNKHCVQIALGYTWISFIMIFIIIKLQNTNITLNPGTFRTSNDTKIAASHRRALSLCYWIFTRWYHQSHIFQKLSFIASTTAQLQPLRDPKTSFVVQFFDVTTEQRIFQSPALIIQLSRPAVWQKAFPLIPY